MGAFFSIALFSVFLFFRFLNGEMFICILNEYITMSGTTSQFKYLWLSIIFHNDQQCAFYFWVNALFFSVYIFHPIAIFSRCLSITQHNFINNLLTIMFAQNAVCVYCFRFIQSVFSTNQMQGKKTVVHKNCWINK